VQVRRGGTQVDEADGQFFQAEQPAEKAVTVSDSGAAIDPVCGMEVSIANARHHSNVDGRDFYFCCPACKRLFERNPQEYLVQPEA